MLRIVFELGVTVILFSTAWSSYSAAKKAPDARPTTNAMALGAFIGGSIALLMSAQTLLQLSRKKKEGPGG